MLNYQKLDLTKFSGLTNRIIGSSTNTFSAINCFYINNMKKIETAYGFRCLYPATSDGREILDINKVYGDYIYITTQDVRYIKPDGSQRTLVKHYQNPVNTDQRVYSSEWRGQIIYGHMTRGLTGEYSNHYRVYPISNGGTKQYVCYRVGTPDFSGASITEGDTTDSKLYQYKLVYCTTFTTYDGVTYKEYSRPQYFRRYQDANISSSNPVSISINSNITDTEVDLSNTKIEIYRTLANGTTYYRVAELNLTASSHTDSTEDVNLVKHQAYYGNGMADIGRPPKAGLMKIIGGTGWYGDIVDGNDAYNYRVIQSMSGIPTSVNMSWYDDFGSRVTGIGSVGSVPIIFTEKEIYRLDGQIAPDGTGSFRKRAISTTVGCVSHNSIAEINGKIYFAGNDGFYVTDGYQVVSISATPEYDITELYSELTQDMLDVDENTHLPIYDIDHFRKRITVFVDSKEEIVKWCCTASKGTHNNIILMYSIRNKCFTTETCRSATYTAAIEYKGGFIRGDGVGNILTHNKDYFDGVVPDPNKTPSEWAYTRLPFELQSSVIEFGSSSKKKWINNVAITIETKGRTAFSLNSSNDGSSQGLEMSPIEFMGIISWRDKSVLWRQDNIMWRPAPLRTIKRRFPKRHLRCRGKQLGLAPVNVYVYFSSEYGQVNIEPIEEGKIDYFYVRIAGSYVTNPGDNYAKFPLDITGYSMEFSGDNYTTSHEVVERIDNYKVRVAGGSLSTNNPQDFKAYGKLKRQHFTIDSIVYNFALMTDVGVEDVGKV